MKKLFPVFALFVFISACSEPVSQHSDNEEIKAITKSKVKREGTYYPIPSPEQMFEFISDNGIKYHQNLMNLTENSSSYTDPNIKALNFGIYTADLAYCASYQDIEATISHYKVVRELSKELNIADLMSPEMMSEIESHLQNPDSLAIVAGECYYMAVEYLESNHQEVKLCMMSLGGWIETLYITINAVEVFDPNSATAQRIADQKLTFGNLYTYLKTNEENPEVARQIEKLLKIRSVFASLEEVKVGKSSSRNSSGKLVLGGGSKISISEQQFSDLKTAVNNYREEITKI